MQHFSHHITRRLSRVLAMLALSMALVASAAVHLDPAGAAKPRPVPSTVVGAPAVVARTSNNLDVFVRTSKGNIQTTWWNGHAGWAGRWVSLGLTDAISDPAVFAYGSLDVVVLRSDRRMYRNTWHDISGWSGWSVIPGSPQFVGTPAITGSASNIVVAGRDASGRVWTARSDRNWSTLQPFTFGWRVATTGATSDPSIGTLSAGSGNTMLAVRNAAGTVSIIEVQHPYQSCQACTIVPGSATVKYTSQSFAAPGTSPKLLAHRYSPDRIELVAQDAAGGSQLSQTTFEYVHYGLEFLLPIAFQYPGGAYRSDPTLVSPSGFNTVLYVRGTNDALYHISNYPGPAASVWTAVPGGPTLTGQPVAVSRAEHLIDVFVTGPGGRLWTTWASVDFDGGWLQLPPTL